MEVDMQVASPNILAVLLMAVVYMVIASIWYSEAVFGKLWLKACGKEGEKCCKPTMKQHISAFIVAFVTAYVLSCMINHMGVNDAMTGARTAFWAWLGFVATTMYSGVVWCKKPLTTYFVDAGFLLVTFIIWGAVFGVWQ